VTTRTVKLGPMLSSLIERGGYSRNRQAILEAVDVSPQALSQYTRDQTRPSFQKLTALADFFGVSLDYLVYGEPVSAAVDAGPLARYVESALTEVQARASRHADLLGRIGRVLTDRIDAVALELADSSTAGREGLIQQDETIRMERYCRKADIVAMHLGFDVIEMADGGGTVGGQFFHVVQANVAKGCQYRFLLPDDENDQEMAVASFRTLLTHSVGGDQALEYCHFRRSVQPMVAGVGLYQLDTVALELQEPALHTQFSDYLGADGWLGYAIRPNDDSKADMMMSIDHARRARSAFEKLWSTSTPL
jgi:transcriptional regulator with XRE-family HTH domain